MLRKLTPDPTRAEPVRGSRNERLVAPVGLIAAGFTTACCLGVSAALSFAPALGATFLTRDSTLEPILIVTLLVTCAGSAFTYWRYRRTIGPLALTVVASVWIYLLVFGLDAGHGGHGAMHDHMNDTHASSTVHHGLSTGRQSLVWVGLAVLVGAQVWDLVRIRQPRTLTEPIAAAAGGDR